MKAPLRASLAAISLCGAFGLSGCASPHAEPSTPGAGFVEGRPIQPPAPVTPETPAEPLTAAANPASPVPDPGLVEVFPHVRVDRAARTVEIDGAVAVDTHDPATPRVYLEVLVCTPDTREHEALVVTRARPAHVHAALLMLGVEPGAPGGFDWSGKAVKPIEPSGPTLTVAFRPAHSTEHDPWAWVSIVGPNDQESVTRPPGRFVFAGSRFAKRPDPTTGEIRELYDADGAGTLVGLTTFGSETVAWSTVWSPDSAIQEPVWIARASAVPPVGSPVTVVLRAP